MGQSSVTGCGDCRNTSFDVDLTAVEALSADDLRGVLGFLEVAGEVDGVDPFSEPVLAALLRLIPADVVSYGDFDRGGASWRTNVRWQGVQLAPLTGDIRAAHRRFTDQNPHPPWAPAAGHAVRWSDLISKRRLHSLDLYAEVAVPLCGEYQLNLWLRTPDGMAGAFAFDRAEPDFSARDLAVLDTLRPHLVQLWRNASARRRTDAGLLTPRECEILAWVARGKKNGEIAAILYIAPGTVRKHLDNVYEKLGVGNRAAAVARAFLN
jgi:DNA-binding CsgD family transcriptional regulator